jgi:hypothetical protein
MTDALELEIESAYHRLTDCRRIIYLTRSGRLVWGRRAQEMSGDLLEIGTFTHAIDLQSFRDEVFFVFDRRRHAAR